MLTSFIQIPVSADSGAVSASISGTKWENSAYFTVELENTSESDASVSVFVALYDKDGMATSVKKNIVTVKSESVLAKSYSTTFDYKAVIYVWDSKNRPLSKKFSTDDCDEVELKEGERIEITSSDVWASDEPESQNTASNVTDDNLSTIWTVKASENNPQSVTAYLGGTYSVTKVGLALDKATERDYVFSVSLSYDGESFTDIIQNETTKKTNDLQYFEASCLTARYVRVTLYGRSDSEGDVWVRLSSLEAYGFEPDGETFFEDDFSSLEKWNISPMDEMTYTNYSPTLGAKLFAETAEMPETGEGAMRLYDNVDRSSVAEGGKLDVLSVSASQTPQEANVPENVLDGDLSTKWTASNVTDSTPADLTLELEKTYMLTKVSLGFGVGNSRTYVFSVSLSTDGENYETVINRQESAKTLDEQYFSFNQNAAKYVKFTFYGRTDANNNYWIQVTEASVFGTENGIDGAGGILSQLRFTPPKNRANYTISFNLCLPSKIDGKSANNYFSGISLTDGIVTGGADLSHYSAYQLRFENSNGKIKVRKIQSNYFNEGTLSDCFENTFLPDAIWTIKMEVSPLSRKAYITISDGETEETQLLYFAYSDDELTRNSLWSGLEANTLVFNTGAGSKSEMLVSNVKIEKDETFELSSSSETPVNGIIRLEEVRLSDDPTTSAFYGKYVYHDGEDKILAVEADKDPMSTRFVERQGLIGTGVSLEAVSLPGYFVTCENGGFYLKKLENNGEFYANATLVKTAEENIGYYTGKTYSYKTYRDETKYVYDSTARYEMHGDLKAKAPSIKANSVFYLRSEASAYVSDNFYGDSISSQWWTNYPWKSNHPTNDSYNFSALITEKNVIVENGELLLKATKCGAAQNVSGDWGIYYNKWNKDWEAWKGYVGVVSIQNKVFNRQCYIEGSFKQPESPIGYWNAFWLAGRDSWPPEIDIFETLSSSYGSKAWHTAIHGQNDTNNLFGKQTSNIDITTGYHTFALDWGYDYVKFYVDGKIFQRGQNNATINFQKNLRLILNTGIGGWEAEPDDTMVWNDGMRCKYVRCFQY
jgi:hypothetical protein